MHWNRLSRHLKMVTLSSIYVHGSLIISAQMHKVAPFEIMYENINMKTKLNCQIAYMLLQCIEVAHKIRQKQTTSCASIKTTP